MSAAWLLAITLAICALGGLAGRRRALASVGGDARALHSLPVYHGANAAVRSAAPALGLLALWALIQPLWISSVASSAIPEGMDAGLAMAEAHRIAEGIANAVALGAMTPQTAADGAADLAGITAALKEAKQLVTGEISRPILHVAQRIEALEATGGALMAAAVLAVAVGGATWGVAESRPDFRARPVVERRVRVLLLGAASLAIVTTAGIVLSLAFNTVEFFRIYPAREFFLSLTWSPSFGGGSELGVLPLLWGTVYISLIALAVAVPIGLYTAIYLAEYASPRLRSVAKPLLEVLAGIPTIVYGLFALLTVGPILLGAFGKDGLGWMDSGTAAVTAGLVMGVMVIPFVSSLSDDVITAVPQSLRDGSYALGATRSETVKRVVLPAALPGIVGAILLAASRAIGETMIVVLGAGAAARMSLNPFEAMTTVTAKIVSQLTGDADFASPEALVAFALGMTLFVMTLGLNVVALRVVRRFQERYE